MVLELYKQEYLRTNVQFVIGVTLLTHKFTDTQLAFCLEFSVLVDALRELDFI